MPEPSNTLDRLEATFEQVPLVEGKPYIRAADVVHRLNVVLGLGHWTHIVLRDGYDEKADTFWCYGQLAGVIDGMPFTREAYGGKTISRSRTTNLPSPDWGDQQQAAKTDSLKKCAKQIGVAAYLDDPEERARALDEQAQRGRRAPTTPASRPSPPAAAPAPVTNRATGEVYVCADCKQPLQTIKFSNNNTWSVEKLVDECHRLANDAASPVYCGTHFFARKNARANDVAVVRGMRRGGLPVEAAG